MEVSRPRLLEISVDFSVKIDVGPITSLIMYTLRVQIEEGSPAAQDPEKNLRLLSARFVPITLFPYMREAFSSASIRCGIPLSLPFQNVGALFSPEELDIPEPETEHDRLEEQ